MNLYAMLAADEALRVANQRITDLQLEARNERLAHVSRPRGSITTAVRTALSTLRRAIPSFDAAPPTLHPAGSDPPAAGTGSGSTKRGFWRSLFGR